MGERDDSPDVEVDPLDGDPRLPAYFGGAWDAVGAFRRLLVEQGVLRGLIGPREVARLWERHLLNSAAAIPHLPTTGTIVDLGSGAGLPGVVIAAMLPEARVVLLEPMERRTDWLREVTATLGLANAEVLRGRAQDVGALDADAVTSRAVAAMEKLYGWAGPLVRPGGSLVALKGERAEEEVESGHKAAQKYGFRDARVHIVNSIEGVAPTRVVVAVRGDKRSVR